MRAFDELKPLASSLTEVNLRAFFPFLLIFISVFLIINIETAISKINPPKIFKWIKNSNVQDKEMIKTFNCGVGFCLIINKKNFKKVVKFFAKQYQPYIIGKISSGKKNVILNDKINWF